MFDILLILQCLNTCMDSTSLKRLKIIVPALLAIPGRVTMLSISRWTEEGGSYRSVQRFFNTTIDWKNVQWSLIRQYFQNSLDIFILAGDETIVTKSGKKTFGIDRFFFIPIWKTGSWNINFCFFSCQYKIANLISVNYTTDDPSK